MKINYLFVFVVVLGVVMMASPILGQENPAQINIITDGIIVGDNILDRVPSTACVALVEMSELVCAATTIGPEQDGSNFRYRVVDLVDTRISETMTILSVVWTIHKETGVVQWRPSVIDDDGTQYNTFITALYFR